jgi:hypothetical protein
MRDLETIDSELRLVAVAGPQELVHLDVYPCCWSTVVRVEGRVIIRRSHAPYVSGDGASANRFAAAIG